MEGVNWVCVDALDDHKWVSELTISRQEADVLVAVDYDIEVSFVVQWKMVWFSSPTRLNRIFSDSGTKSRNTMKLKTLSLRSRCLSGGPHQECAC